MPLDRDSLFLEIYGFTAEELADFGLTREDLERYESMIVDPRPDPDGIRRVTQAIESGALEENSVLSIEALLFLGGVMAEDAPGHTSRPTNDPRKS